MAERVEIVRCRKVNGDLCELTLTDRGEFVSPGSSLSQRLVVANDVPLIKKFVPGTVGNRNPRHYDLLDNEVRAGTRLGQVYDDRYPGELAKLVAYNMDVEEPFVLLRAYVGQAVSGLERLDEHRRGFQVGLLRALHFLGAAGVVHGAIALNVVRWNGTQLQLVDFEWAERVGEPRRAGEPRLAGDGARVRSPEQADGTGEVHVRDDLWAAGLLIRQVATGLPANRPWQDHSGEPELLRTLLDPIFSNRVEERPAPEELLRILRAGVSPPPLTDPDAELAAGRRLFEQVSARKRGSDPVESPNGLPGPRPSRRSWRLPFLATMVVVAMLIVGVAVLI